MKRQPQFSLHKGDPMANVRMAGLQEQHFQITFNLMNPEYLCQLESNHADRVPADRQHNLPIINMYLLSTPALPIIDIVVYYLLWDYPDLHEACHGPEAYCRSSFEQKEVNRKERAMKPASRYGKEGRYQTRSKSDEVGTECPIH